MTPGGQTCVVKDNVLIGRLACLEIILDDGSVSRRHAEIRPVDQGWEVVDCGSTNGTYLNGVRLGAQPHQFGLRDIIQFGKVAFLVEMTEEFWLELTEPKALLRFVQGSASERKLRLFACACIQASMDYFPFTYFTQFWHEVLNAAYRLEDNSISASEVTGLVQLNRVVIDYRHTLLVEQLAHSFTLGNLSELSVSLGILVNDSRSTHYWQPSSVLLAAFSHYIRDIFGNPFRRVTLDPSWLTSTVVALAEGIYQEMAFDRMPILSDALMDTGCDNEDLLNHCRHAGEHCRGCWVLDLILGKV
jgi:hypothetical protein